MYACKACELWAIRRVGAPRLHPCTLGARRSLYARTPAHACTHPRACAVRCAWLQGYQGPLCMVCAPGYGSTDIAQCIQCSTNPRLNQLYWALVTALSLAMLSLTIYTSLKVLRNKRTRMAVRYCTKCGHAAAHACMHACCPAVRPVRAVPLPIALVSRCMHAWTRMCVPSTTVHRP